MIPTVLERAAHEVSAGATPEQTVEGMSRGQLILDGEPMVNMASNDYLGFAHDGRVLTAARQCLEHWGLGAAAGRVLCGTTAVHVGLEARLASWVGCEKSILHGSCWTANAAVLAALAGLAHAKTTLAVFSDRLNHASIIDAIRAQRSAIGGLHRYDHGQLDSLRDALGASPSGLQRVVITDGVFSMEGDLARYRSSSTLCATYDALLIVDDCHGTGVTGGSGRGTPEATDTHGKIDVITGTPPRTDQPTSTRSLMRWLAIDRLETSRARR